MDPDDEWETVGDSFTAGSTTIVIDLKGVKSVKVKDGRLSISK